MDTLTLRAGVTNIAEVEISDNAGLNTGTVALNIDGTAAGGTYTLTGNDGANNLKGGSGVNTINAGDGADTIDAGGGSDTVNAGNGNDTVIGTADGVADTYRGDAGTDTIDYSALVAGQNISINLGSGAASGTAIGSDTLASFENATAGGGNDSVFGSSANNVLRGGGGTDNIVGDNGSDQLFGDAGNDTLNGGVNDFGATPAAANDVLWGGADHDTFRFESRFGDDSIGTAGNIGLGRRRGHGVRRLRVGNADHRRCHRRRADHGQRRLGLVDRVRRRRHGGPDADPDLDLGAGSDHPLSRSDTICEGADLGPPLSFQRRVRCALRQFDSTGAMKSIARSRPWQTRQMLPVPRNSSVGLLMSPNCSR